MPTEDNYIAVCRTWVESFVQKHNICPFAARIIKNQELSYHCLRSKDTQACLTDIFVLLSRMQTTEQPESMIIVLPAWQHDFDDFLTFVEIARALLKEQQLESIFQFASFHPDYLFENEDAESTSHYTNRSPWPMLHIIRQRSIAEALESYKNPEEIPKRNVRLMQQMGKQQLAEQLADLQRLTTQT